MNATTALYAAVLFVLLTPGLILRIPSKGSLLTASIVHAVVFGILLYFISKLVHQYKYGVESFMNPFLDKVFDNSGPKCDIEKCQNTIHEAVTKGHEMSTAWWGEKAECTGCTIPGNFHIIRKAV